MCTLVPLALCAADPAAIGGGGPNLLPAATAAHSTAPAVLAPVVAASAAVVLAAADCMLKVHWLEWLFLAFQSLAGAYFAYLAAIPNYPAMSWNWLIVPFNLLPLVFWKWRTKWALRFAGVLVLWEIWMVAAPHRLVAPAYLVLVAAYVLLYLRIGLSGERMRRAVNRAIARYIPRAIRWLDDGTTL